MLRVYVKEMTEGWMEELWLSVWTRESKICANVKRCALSTLVAKNIIKLASWILISKLQLDFHLHGTSCHVSKF